MSRNGENQGNVFFDGRKKDAIRRRGENISAFEIEEVLTAHDAVLEVAAYGVASDLTEEDGAVAIVLRPGGSVSEEELREFCRERMAQYMVPEFVTFRDALPKTPTEKVSKAVLRDEHVRIAAERAARVVDE